MTLMSVNSVGVQPLRSNVQSGSGMLALKKWRSLSIACPDIRNPESESQNNINLQIIFTIFSLVGTNLCMVYS